MQRCARCGADRPRGSARACAACGAPAPTAPDAEAPPIGRGRTEVGAFVPPPGVGVGAAARVPPPSESAVLAVLTRPSRRSPLEQGARALGGVVLALGLALASLLGLDALARGGQLAAPSESLARWLGLSTASVTRGVVLALVLVGSLVAGYLGPRLAGGRR
jgi:hypothetical protein